LFFTRQFKDKTGTKLTRHKTLDREKGKKDSNHVRTSVDAYTDGALDEWFDDRDLATDLQLSLNKSCLASMGFVFFTAVPNTKLCAGVGRGTVEDMCYEIRRAEACVD
jgi:hypothetical protein